MKKKFLLVNDFKTFISKGNILDMAVGVVIGSAFGKIVSSLVADIITPLISLVTGAVNLSEIYFALNRVNGVKCDYSLYTTVTQAQAAGYTTLNYGNFIQTAIDFLIIAFTIFIVLRIIIKSKAKIESMRIKDAAAPISPAPKGPTQEELLIEIRDLLKKNK